MYSRIKTRYDKKIRTVATPLTGGGLTVPKSRDRIIKIIHTILILDGFLGITESAEKIAKPGGPSVAVWVPVIIENRFIIDMRVNGMWSETGAGGARDGIDIEESGILIGRARGSGSFGEM